MRKKTILLLLCLLIPLAGAPHAQDIMPHMSRAPEAHQLLEHTGFTVSYNNVTKCPNWVAWTLTPQEAAADVTGRTDFFTVDPLVSGPQAEYSDYSRNKYGLDRGHMAPSADFKWSVEANQETFYLTNICPQNHTLNEGLWLELEQRCRAMAKRYNTDIHIVCGPIHAQTPDCIGKNRVHVPEAFFKCIMLRRDGIDYAIAFILPNQPVDIQEDIFNYAVSLSIIEQRSGVIPFPNNECREPGNQHPFDIPWKKPKSK